MMKDKCLDCGLDYSQMGLDLVLPDQQWKVVCPEGGILCANCICKRADKVWGTAILAWVDNMDYECVSLPSGLPKIDTSHLKLKKIFHVKVDYPPKKKG